LSSRKVYDIRIAIVGIDERVVNVNTDVAARVLNDERHSNSFYNRIPIRLYASKVKILLETMKSPLFHIVVQLRGRAMTDVVQQVERQMAV
jgi:hypothetical protein